MATVRFWALCAACVVWALAVFVRIELEALAERAAVSIAKAILTPVAWAVMRRPGWLA